MSYDTLPCPFCGSTNLRYEFAGSQGYIQCNECGTEGPCDERAADPICDMDAAYAAWNRRTALSEPEPEGPTLDDIWELCEEHGFVLGIDGANEDESASGLWAIARAVLARWGRPAPQPVPVSERLPGPGDCDEQGRCWFGAPDRPGAVACWDLECEPATDDTHWLPAHALPVPPND